MYHLFSIIATLSVVSAIPLPQYDLPTSSDFVISEPLGTTSIDTANANTYLPTAPIIISEETAPSPSIPARRPGLDSSWDGKDREPTYGDRTGYGPQPKTDGLSQEAIDYWAGRGFPRLRGLGQPATPNQNGGSYSPPPIRPEDAPSPEPNNDAGVAGAATSVIKKIIDSVPPGLNPSPAGGY